MNFALTIHDHKITGVHQSSKPFAPDTFELNPALSTHEVRVIPALGEYQSGVDIRCYHEDGTLRDLVWCITEGYMDIPPGYELIDGELVETHVPEAQAPPRLMERILQAEAAHEEEAAATRTVFRVLAHANVLTQEQALEHETMFEDWADRIGTVVDTGEYLRHEGLYRVKQSHTPQAHQPPGVHTAALYTRVQEPGAGPEPWVQGQSYSKDVQVTHGGKTWISMVPNNVWEPGAAGVFDSIWKEVIV